MESVTSQPSCHCRWLQVYTRGESWLPLLLSQGAQQLAQGLVPLPQMLLWEGPPPVATCPSTSPGPSALSSYRKSWDLPVSGRYWSQIKEREEGKNKNTQNDQAKPGGEQSPVHPQ